MTKGGYPTFSGGGLTNPQRQVPIGFIEHTKDGRKIEFVSEHTGEPIKVPAEMAEDTQIRAQRRSQLPPRRIHEPRIFVYRRAALSDASTRADVLIFQAIAKEPAHCAQGGRGIIVG